MIVCHCAVVSDTAIVEAVAAGADTLDAVVTETGAGAGCRACLEVMATLVERHRSHPSERTQE